GVARADRQRARRTPGAGRRGRGARDLPRVYPDARAAARRTGEPAGHYDLQRNRAYEDPAVAQRIADLHRGAADPSGGTAAAAGRTEDVERTAAGPDRSFGEEE